MFFFVLELVIFLFLYIFVDKSSLFPFFYLSSVSSLPLLFFLSTIFPSCNFSYFSELQKKIFVLKSDKQHQKQFVIGNWMVLKPSRVFCIQKKSFYTFKLTITLSTKSQNFFRQSKKGNTYVSIAFLYFLLVKTMLLEKCDKELLKNNEKSEY